MRCILVPPSPGFPPGKGAVAYDSDVLAKQPYALDRDAGSVAVALTAALVGLEAIVCVIVLVVVSVLVNIYVPVVVVGTRR